MKKLVFILSFSILVIGTYSCRKPQVPIIEKGRGTGDTTGGGEILPSAFVGSWEYTNIDLNNGTLKIMGQDLGEFTGKGKDIVGQVVISENPNTYTTELSFNADITVFGQVQEIPVERQTSSGTWTETNGEIALKDNSGKAIGVISSTSSKIVFTGNFTEQIDVQFGSIDANSDVEFTIEK